MFLFRLLVQYTTLLGKGGENVHVHEKISPADLILIPAKIKQITGRL